MDDFRLKRKISRFNSPNSSPGTSTAPSTAPSRNNSEDVTVIDLYSGLQNTLPSEILKSDNLKANANVNANITDSFGTIDTKISVKKTTIEDAKKYIDKFKDEYHRSKKYALVFKYLGIFLAIVILIGSSVSILTALLDASYTKVIIAMNAMVGAVQLGTTMFPLQSKGAMYKTVSIKYRKMVKKLIQLVQLKAPSIDIRNALARFDADLDEIDLALYSGDTQISNFHL